MMMVQQFGLTYRKTVAPLQGSLKGVLACVCETS